MKRSFKLLGLITLTSTTVLAGNLDPPSVPGTASSGMYSIQSLCDRLQTGAAGSQNIFTEPTSGPGSTGCTLNEVMTKAPTLDETNGATPAEVATGKKFWGLKSGSWGLQTGTATISACTPNANADPVFTDNGNGTVKDHRTCLIWLQDASCVGQRAWDAVDTSVEVVTLINATTCANYTTGTFSDWRLPTVQETTKSGSLWLLFSYHV